MILNDLILNFRAHMMQERFFGHNSLSSILRNTVNRIGNSYIVHGSGGRGSDAWRHSFGGRGGSGIPGGHTVSSLLGQGSAIKVKGRQLLDQDGLTCLLIILFIDDPKINTTRLHRILKNLCYHAPTRDWVIKSLLSILEKSNEKQSVLTTDTTSIQVILGENLLIGGRASKASKSATVFFARGEAAKKESFVIFFKKESFCEIQPDGTASENCSLVTKM